MKPVFDTGTLYKISNLSECNAVKLLDSEFCKYTGRKVTIPEDSVILCVGSRKLLRPDAIVAMGAEYIFLFGDDLIGIPSWIL